MGAGELDDLVSDFARFYVLTILYEGPTHGYGILSKFKKRVGKSISPGFIYPFLQELEGLGFVAYKIEAVGEKEKKMYELTDEGRALCNRLFKRFAGLVSTAIEPGLDICAHCGCTLYEGGHTEVVEGVEHVFCCVHCAMAYKRDKGIVR